MPLNDLGHRLLPGNQLRHLLLELLQPLEHRHLVHVLALTWFSSLFLHPNAESTLRRGSDSYGRAGVRCPPPDATLPCGIWAALHLCPDGCTLVRFSRRVPVSEVRYPLAQVTAASRDGWRKFTKRYGGNPTALAEVMGLYLGGVTGDLPPLLRHLVNEAEELEERRRSRRPEEM